MPLSARIVKDVLYDTFSNLGEKDCTFYHGTYAGHPIGQRSPPCVSRSRKHRCQYRKAAMREQMKPLEQRCVKETRFLGMIGVVELHAQFADEMSHIKQTLRRRHPSALGTIIYLMPPDYFH